MGTGWLTNLLPFVLLVNYRRTSYPQKRRLQSRPLPPHLPTTTQPCPRKINNEKKKNSPSPQSALFSLHTGNGVFFLKYGGAAHTVSLGNGTSAPILRASGLQWYLRIVFLSLPVWRNKSCSSCPPSEVEGRGSVSGVGVSRTGGGRRYCGDVTCRYQLQEHTGMSGNKNAHECVSEREWRGTSERVVIINSGFIVKAERPKERFSLSTTSYISCVGGA